MKRSDQEPLLFDLPLDRPGRDDRAYDDAADEEPDRPLTRKQRARAAAAAAAATAAALRAAKPAAVPPPAGRDTAAGQAPDRDAAHGAGVGRRLAGGAADLLIHAAVGVLAFVGCRALGVFPALHDWPAGAVFLLSFSFLYTVVPLAFWGHTLGMTWAGLTAQSGDGEPLSFDQTARRWAGSLLTLAALGLPTLVALTGRSLADRLSASVTLPANR